MILTKKETNTPIRVSSMRFKAKPEILVSVPCVTVTLRKAMQVMFVNAFLRMKSTRYLKGASAKGCFSSCLGLVILKWGRFFDDLGKKHEWNDAKRDQQIGKDGMRLEFDATDQEKHEHAGETADKGADCPVQPDTERTLDFRLQANHRRDGRIKRRTGSDIKKKIDQTADKDRYRCLDDDDSHIKLIIKTVFIS